MKTILLLVLLASVGCAADRIDPNMRDEGVDRAPIDTGSIVDAAEEIQVEDAEVPDVRIPVQDSMGPSCVPDNDGVLQRSEVPYALGASVLWAVNRDGTTVDGIRTAPEDTPDGPRWNFSSMVASDSRILDEVRSPTGQWWSVRYPTATFTLPLDRAGSLFGVYRATPTALQLLATVSREMNRTELALDPPVDVLRFPLQNGSQWEQSVTARGLLDFVAHTNVTRYTFRIDGRGTVWTPAGRFPSLRLRMELDQSIPLTVFRRTQRTYVFLSECWGLVARVTSVDNETAAEFTRASEYRRLGL